MTIEKLPERSWARDTGLRELEYSDEEKIRGLLLGRKVIEVDGDHMRLDDGTVVRVVPNEGGCSCGAGDYALTALNGVDNVITRVDFECEPKSDADSYDAGYAYRIFVFADNQRINLLTVEGDDGNGYYGTGFDLVVKHVDAAGGEREAAPEPRTWK